MKGSMLGIWSLNPWQTEKNYNIQRNVCKKLLGTTKKQYFNKLDTKKVTHNITFGELLHTFQPVSFKIRNNDPPVQWLKFWKCTSNYKVNVKIALLFPKNYVAMTKVHEC